MFMLPALAFLQAPVPAPAQAPKPDPVPPARITLTTPFPVHLGKVGPREIREAAYGIRSTHDRPFHFRVLDLSPGVTLDETQFAEPMKPGELRTIRLKVDPSGMVGHIKGAVRLGTDDPTQPSYILRLDMEVRPEVAVDSERKSLGEVAPHERPEARFHFTREGGDPLKLVLASAVPDYLSADLAHEGTAADLRLVLHPERLKPGVVAGLDIFKVATNGPQQPLFTLYLDWRVVTPVIPTPSRLVFADLATTQLTVELAARDGKPFRITKADIQGSGFELVEAPGPEAAKQVLRVRRVGHDPEAMLVLTCSNQEGPLHIPLRFLDPTVKPADPSAPADPRP
ncbi:hypothetical protein [Geothrix sp. PMB-07]|uniref:hypothetical protein n=1 Tax=Geothrix sp. PMB-07 TaxID=3068640 RepID=UPI0027416CA2|nr:hypothetical protein [Geothrix sp. PMB-07]WLT31824.1 hypothetical protein Q9293_00540 [Geothrix sp. PMB-07]